MGFVIEVVALLLMVGVLWGAATKREEAILLPLAWGAAGAGFWIFLVVGLSL